MSDIIKPGGKLTKKLIVATLSIFLLFALIFYLLPGMASFLIFKTNLQHADVIIVLGGDKERLHYGIKLYKSNYSDKIIISGDKEVWKKQAVESWVTPKNIIIEDKSTTTYENAKFSRNIMLQNHFTSAIVVSSPYHMRRVSWLFGDVFKDDNITLLYSPVDNSWFKPNKWWTNKMERRVVLYEYAKFIYYTPMFLKNRLYKIILLSLSK
jgi:uncharacterized SAM-binding protein YcdF (DUF218 family)